MKHLSLGRECLNILKCSVSFYLLFRHLFPQEFLHRSFSTGQIRYSSLPCIIAALCGYIACLLASSISMLVAAKTRGTIIAIVIPLLLFLITPFIVRNIRVQYDFLTLLPYHLNNVLNCSRIPYIYQIGSFVFRQIPFLMLVYFGIAVLLIPLTYQCYRKIIVSS